jgi:hypothetical protein
LRMIVRCMNSRCGTEWHPEKQWHYFPVSVVEETTGTMHSTTVEQSEAALDVLRAAVGGAALDAPAINAIVKAAAVHVVALAPIADRPYAANYSCTAAVFTA